MRYVIETECEHGEVAEHSTHTPKDAQAAFDAGDPDAVYTNPKFSCPGGSRRVVEPTEPDWNIAYNELKTADIRIRPSQFSKMVEAFTAALAGLVVIDPLDKEN